MRTMWLALIFLIASPLAAAETSFLEAAAQLDGKWRGEDYTLRVDSYRAQANVDVTRPFQWQRFLVKEVDGETVTFSVGAELFEALMRADRLTLTSTSFRGKRTLRRIPEGAAAR